MQKTWILFFSITFAIGCGQGAVGVDGMVGSVQSSIVEETEVFYVTDGLGLARLEAERPFDNVDFHVSLADAQIRALDASGEVVVDWADVSTFVDDEDPAAHEGVIELPRSATAVELRMNSEVEFARIVVGAGEPHAHEGELEIPEGATTTLAAHSGRWVPPNSVVSAGNQQHLPYTGAPSRCTGSLLPGTRALAEHLKAKFRGAVSYGGYACRANTANAGELSVHASGRAIDLFVPLDRGQADNDLGDPIAHYLIQNAQSLGIEFIVWDRTSWGAHRPAPKHRYYSGPHPHHDHLHIELAPWAASDGNVSVGNAPRGYLDAANCGGIAGWTQDPDAPDAALDVYVSIGGPVFTQGAHGANARANEHRQDLCSAIGSCSHGWYTKVPHGLMDGVARKVYAYAHDATGGQSAELFGAGKTLRCDPPRLPYDGSQAVKRHVTSPESFQAWGFQWNDIIKVSDRKLESFRTGAALPHRPTLVSDGPPVFVIEGGVKRHVPNPRALHAWGLKWGEVRPAATGSLHTGRPLEQRPYLVQGSGPAVYLLWPK